MIIRVYDHTVADAFAGEDQVYCAHQTSTTQLDADAATSTASGSWTRLSGSGTIVDPTAHNTVVNDLALGDNWFVWTVDNGACGTTSGYRDGVLEGLPHHHHPGCVLAER